jgi:4-hydroxybenzoate polyprenyltransferase
MSLQDNSSGTTFPGGAWLELGRVSNLPTIWTNVLAGIALGGVDPGIASAIVLAASMSLVYTGGMFLNDAFDRGYDARFRPSRPIPSGRVRASSVFLAGFCAVAAGFALLITAQTLGGAARGPQAPAFGLALATLVIVYDWKHKANPVAPVMLGLCRGLVYLSAAAASSGSALTMPVLFGAVLLVSYVTGVSLLARRESGAAGQVAVRPQTIGLFLAGISLLDAVLIASLTWRIGWAIAALSGMVLTRALQRYVPGS